MSQEPEFKVYPLSPYLRVSKDGRVESCAHSRLEVCSLKWRPKKVTADMSCNGYPHVTAKFPDGKSRMVTVHKLVAWTWIGPKPGPEQMVRHLDDNKLNYHLSNLSWGTAKDNADDYKRNLCDIRARKRSNPGRLVTPYEYERYQDWLDSGSPKPAPDAEKRKARARNARDLKRFNAVYERLCAEPLTEPFAFANYSAPEHP